ncbi:MAG: hypothetical protein HYW89_00810 [Candidatus Sungiibacteriota bacterium]|uniref:UDP-N-acetylglucosamine 2-epimerase domain-containing protein n=1 Tax=Candidatus Sungiibacteriota bacterium TaxID=2750080 RepID=A0A7T5RKM8_9BACT|nr:MAG: hypothetical protein HYW89_00810 [Candidatus Sungbacteria bacterium]
MVKDVRPVVLVAHDTAPSQALDRVKKNLEEQSAWSAADPNAPRHLNPTWPVTAFLGYGKPSKASIEEIISAVKQAAVVVLGMSNPADNAVVEIVAAKAALDQGIPFGFYCDIYGCHYRPWFEEFRNSASFLFQISDSEAASAQKLFPKAEVVASGNPIWEEWFLPLSSYEEVRAELGVGLDEKLIVLSGSKSPYTNMPMVIGVMEALHVPHKMYRKFQVLLSLHPSDVTLNPQNDLTDSLIKYPEPKIYYEEAAVTRYCGVPFRVIPGDRKSGIGGMSTSRLIVGSDLVIGPASTSEVEAAHRRKPAVSYLSCYSRGRNPESYGQEEWQPAVLGASIGVYGDPTHLWQVIAGLLFYDGYVGQKRLQEREYPYREPGIAVSKMAATIQKYARQS